jgi:hypothetical protein
MDESRALNSRAEQLENWAQSLRGLAPAARILREAGQPSKAIEEAAALRRSAVRARDDFRRDPSTLRRPGAEAANIFWRQASQKVGEATATVRGEWRDYVNGLMPRYQAAVVRALAGDEATTVETTLADAARRASSLAGRIPESVTEAEQAAALAMQVARLLQRFDLSREPSEVRLFVEAALEDRATIDLLTDTVRDWLIERGIDRNVRLSFVSK